MPHLARAGTPRDIDGYLAGGHLAPDAADQQLVLATEALRQYVCFRISFRRRPVCLSVGIAEHHTAAGCTRIVERTNGACRLLHGQVDIRLPCPDHAYLAIANLRRIDCLLEI